jgi:hypothetical protein
MAIAAAVPLNTSMIRFIHLRRACPLIQIIHFFAAFREVIRQTSVRAITLTINVTPKSINASSIKLPVWTPVEASPN